MVRSPKSDLMNLPLPTAVLFECGDIVPPVLGSPSNCISKTFRGTSSETAGKWLCCASGNRLAATRELLTVVRSLKRGFRKLLLLKLHQAASGIHQCRSSLLRDSIIILSLWKT